MLLSTWRSLRRRWYVTIAGLAVTAGLVTTASFLVPASYVASTQVVLLPPHSQRGSDAGSDGSAAGTNPYMSLAGLDGMADLVSRAMMDETSMRQLHSLGVSDAYTAEHDTLSPAPIIVLTAQEASAAQASGSLDILTNQVPQTVTRLQADSSIPPDARVSVAVVARPSAPVRSGKSQLRAVAVALVVGLVLTVLAAAFVEALWQRRRAAVPGAEENDGMAGASSRGHADGGDLARVPEWSLPVPPPGYDPRAEQPPHEAAAREAAYEQAAYEPAQEQTADEMVPDRQVDYETATYGTAADEGAEYEGTEYEGTEYDDADQEATDQEAQTEETASEAGESDRGRSVLRSMNPGGGTIDELDGAGTNWEKVLSAARASLSRRLQELAEEALVPPATPRHPAAGTSPGNEPHLKAINGAANTDRRMKGDHRPSAARGQDETSGDQELGETGTSPR
jgi:capsular polysaccharide biosynthesis protein